MEPDDVTLSDVHLDVCRPNTASQPDCDVNGYIVCKSRFAFTMPLQLCCRDNEDTADDDQKVTRRRSVCQREVIYLTHTLETQLKDVGLQVWPGCLLLCDYLLSCHPPEGTLLELGAGVGLASIVGAIQAKMVIATDIGEHVLCMCEDNLRAHQYMYRHTAPYIVRELNFFDKSLKSTDSSKYGWSESDENLLKQVDTIVAADVIYDVDITDALFRTLERLVESTSVSSIIIALEQRLNFTLSELDVSCPAYNHFLQHLQRLATHTTSSYQHDTTSSQEQDTTSPTQQDTTPFTSLQCRDSNAQPQQDIASSHSQATTGTPNTGTFYHVRQMNTQTIPHHFHGYNRSKYLELWEISVSRGTVQQEDRVGTQE